MASIKSVFISSTSMDLQKHRAAVREALLSLEILPRDMIFWGAEDGDAVEVSLKHVRKADIFIGILAHRYGYMPPGSTKSVTEMEYDEAVKQGIPRLMYLVEPTYEDELMKIDSGETDTQKTGLKKFKAQVEGVRVRSLFTTPDDLARKVTADIAGLMRDMDEPEKDMQPRSPGISISQSGAGNVGIVGDGNVVQPGGCWIFGLIASLMGMKKK